MATPQQQADNLLDLWRLQARLGLKPAERRLPADTSDAAFERDLEIIRRAMERKK